jgi:two-component system sensor histidine kinase KdpD
MAQGLDAEFYVVHVETGKARPDERTRSLAANVRFSENLGAKVVQLKGSVVATTVANFVREQKITQVIFGRSAVHGWRKYLYLAAMNRFLANASAVDVHIVTQESS